MQCFRIQLQIKSYYGFRTGGNTSLIFWTSFRELNKVSRQSNQTNSLKGKTPNNLIDGEEICFDVMVTGPLANTKTLSGHFGYYKTMTNYYTLGKEKLNKILGGKKVHLAIRYLQFNQILAIFGSAKSCSLKYIYSAQKKLETYLVWNLITSRIKWI